MCLFFPSAPGKSVAYFVLLARWDLSCSEMLSLSRVRRSIWLLWKDGASSGVAGTEPQRESLCSALLEWEFQQHFENQRGKGLKLGCVSQALTIAPASLEIIISLWICPTQTAQAICLLDKRESARNRDNVIVSEAGMLLVGSLTLKNGKAQLQDPCIWSSL